MRPSPPALRFKILDSNGSTTRRENFNCSARRAMRSIRRRSVSTGDRKRSRSTSPPALSAIGQKDARQASMNCRHWSTPLKSELRKTCCFPLVAAPWFCRRRWARSPTHPLLHQGLICTGRLSSVAVLKRRQATLPPLETPAGNTRSGSFGGLDFACRINQNARDRNAALHDSCVAFSGS